MYRYKRDPSFCDDTVSHQRTYCCSTAPFFSFLLLDIQEQLAQSTTVHDNA